MADDTVNVPNPFQTNVVDDRSTLNQAIQTEAGLDTNVPVTLGMFGVPPAAASQSLQNQGYNVAPSDTSPKPYNVSEYKPIMTNVPLNTDDAQDRASRFHYALGYESPGVQKLFSDIINNNEAVIRERTANGAVNLDQQDRMQLLDKYITQISTGDIGPNEVQQAIDIINAPNEAIDPNTILERKYADRLTASVERVNNYRNKAIAQSTGNGSVYNYVQDTTRNFLAQQQIVRNIYDEVKAEYDKQGWGNYIYDEISGFASMGFREWILLGDGTSRQNYVQNIYTLSPEKFERQVRKDLSQLNNPIVGTGESVPSPEMKMNYIKSLMGYSSTDAALENLGIAVNVSMLVAGPMLSLQKAILRRAGVDLAASGAASTIKSAAQKSVSPTQIADAGDPVFAARMAALRETDPGEALKQTAERTGQDISPITDRLYDAVNPATLTGSQSLSNPTLVNRFITTIKGGTDDLLNAMFNKPLTVNRLTEEQVTDALDQTMDKFKRTFPSVSTSIQQVKRIPAEETLWKTDTLQIDIGSQNGGLFRSQKEAEAYAKSIGMDNILQIEIPKEIPYQPKPVSPAEKALLDRVGGYRKPFYTYPEEFSFPKNKSTPDTFIVDKPGPYPKKTVRDTKGKFVKSANVPDSNASLPSYSKNNDAQAEWTGHSQVPTASFGTGDHFNYIQAEWANLPNPLSTPPVNRRKSLDFQSILNKKTSTPPLKQVFVSPCTNGYSIRMFLTPDESSPGIRSLLGNVYYKSSDDIKNGMKYWLPFLRTSKDLMTQGISKWMDVSAIGHSGIEKASQGLWNAIESLPGQPKLPFASWREPREGTSAKLFRDYISSQRDYVDPTTNVRGRFDKTVPEFEQNWLQAHGHLPTAQETTAYFAYTNISDLDHAAYELGILRDKARLGTVSVKLPINMKAGGTKLSEAFDGRVIDALPNSREPYNILVHDPDTSKVVRIHSSQMSDKRAAQFEAEGYKVLKVDTQLSSATDALKRTPEYKLPDKNTDLNASSISDLQAKIKDATDNIAKAKAAKDKEAGKAARANLKSLNTQLKEAQKGPVIGKHLLENNSPIHYILTKDFNQSTISAQQLPYRAGGHVALQNPWMISQPHINQMRDHNGTIWSTFYGDRNIFSAQYERDAQGFAKNLEKSRVAYKQWKDGLITEDRAKEIVSAHMPVDVEEEGLPSTLARRFNITDKHPIPITWEDFKGYFEGNNKFLDPDTPIVHRPLNQSSFTFSNLKGMTDQDGVPRFPNIRTASDSEHSLYQNQINLKYATERGDHIGSIIDRGGKYCPSYNVVATGHIDPWTNLKHSMASVARGRTMDDLKFKMAENFIENFRDVLDTPISVLRSDPLRALTDRQFAPFKENVPEQFNKALGVAKAYARASQMFLNIKPNYQIGIDRVVASMENYLYENLGAPGAEFLRSTVKPISNVNNTTAQIRALTFDHSTFLNPAKLFMNGLASVHTMAILGPRAGLRAMGAAPFLQFLGSRASPDLVKRFAEMASNLGYKHLEAAYYALDRTNFHLVGNETADLNDIMKSSMTSGFIDDVRNRARLFFKGGESFNRMTAWAGAFEEWVTANPKKTITNSDIASILYRADTLTLNMMASSQAAWQKGLLSIPAQYSSWSVRLAEQLLPGWSNRLTWQEKLQAFFTYSVIFGLPIASTGTLGVWPIHTSIREYVQHHYGANLNDSTIGELFNTGILQTLTHHLFGPNLALSDRFGPYGVQITQALAEPNNGQWVYNLWGPSGALFKQYVNVVSPYYHWVANAFNKSEDTFPLTEKDIENTLEPLRVASQARKAWIAYNTGKYISANGIDMASGIDKASAFAIFLTGALPQKVQDAFDNAEMLHELKNIKDDYKKQIMDAARAMAKAAWENDMDAARDYGKQIKLWTIQGGYSDPERAKLVQEALKQNGDYVERVNKQLYELNDATRQRILDGK